MDWDDPEPRYFREIPPGLKPMRRGDAFSFQMACVAAIGTAVCGLIGAAFFVAAVMATQARGRDLGQWAQNDPETSAWYERQKMPDHPQQSCCGAGDAYYADRSEVDNKGNVFAIITDTREDAPLSRPNIPVGTQILIPDFKNKDTRSDPNPTGHTVIFVRWYAEQEGGNWGVLCFLPSGGV